MNALKILAATAALAAVAPAQLQLCTINPFAANNGGAAGGAVYFDITVNLPVNITSFDCNFGSVAGTAAGLQVWTTPGTAVGNEQNPAVWTQVAADNGSAVAAGRDLVTNVPLASALQLAPGSYGMCLVAVGVSHAYTNGNGTNQAFSSTELSLSLGGGSNTPFGAPTFSPRVWNGCINYAPVGGNFATCDTSGFGCGELQGNSYYEQFGTGTFDLSDTAITHLFNGSNYVVATPAAGNFIVAPTTAPIAIGDDQTVQVTLPFGLPTPNGVINDVYLCSNGWLSLEPTTSNDLSESIGEFEANENRFFAMWDDLNPNNATGGVYTEVDPTDPNTYYITFVGVPEFSATGSNDFQYVLRSNGNVGIRYGTCSVADCLVGYSPGNGITAGSGVDISGLSNGLGLGSGAPVAALNMRCVDRPVIGSTAASETTNVPAGSTVGAVLYGALPIPGGLDLSGIGMTGCSVFNTGDIDVPFTPTAGAVSHPVTIPNNPALAGGLFYQQSVVFVTNGANPLGVVVSNSVDWMLDAN